VVSFAAQQSKLDRLILSGRYSRREIARLCGVSTKTVAAAVLRLKQAGDNFSPSRNLRQPRRCGDCGALLNRWPCVACDAA